MPWADQWGDDNWSIIPAPHLAHIRVIADAEEAKQTGGMVALYPRQDDAAKLAIPGGEPVEDLHCTLAFLGDDLTGHDPTALVNAIASLTDTYSVVTARIMGHAVFNPDGGDPDDNRSADPCAVYLVSDSDELPELHTDVLNAVNHSVTFQPARQHMPYIPHITAGYGISPAQLSYTGSILFDRIGVAFGPQVHYLPLLGATIAPYTA